MRLFNKLINRRRWHWIRLQVFERDGYRCRRCKLPGRLECDHIIPLEHGGSPYDMDNLQTLCRSCHIEKTRRENIGRIRHDTPPDKKAWREYMKAQREK